MLDALKQESSKSGPWGWIAGIIFLILGTAAIAFLSFKLSKNGKELAKLKHEKDVAEEEKKHAEAMERVSFHETIRAAAAERAAEAQEQIEVAEIHLAELQEEHDTLIQRIDRINSWDDVDKIVR